MLCHWRLKRSPEQCLGQPRRISRLRCRVQDDGAEKALPGIGPGLCRRPKFQPVGASQLQPIPARSGWMAGQPWQGLGHFEGRIHICSRRKTFHVQFHNPAGAWIVSKKFRPWKSGRFMPVAFNRKTSQTGRSALEEKEICRRNGKPALPTTLESRPPCSVRVQPMPAEKKAESLKHPHKDKPFL